MSLSYQQKFNIWNWNFILRYSWSFTKIVTQNIAMSHLAIHNVDCFFISKDTSNHKGLQNLLQNYSMQLFSGKFICNLKLLGKYFRKSKQNYEKLYLFSISSTQRENLKIKLYLVTQYHYSMMGVIIFQYDNTILKIHKK